MEYRVGDPVVHWFYGLGEVIQLDEKKYLDRVQQYYVVKMHGLTIWVPVDDSKDNHLRPPTPADRFTHLFEVLASDPELFPSDPSDRRTKLSDLVKNGSLESICQVIRDLTYQRRTKKLNDHDKATLDRLQNFLLDEWALSLSVPILQARHELHRLLKDDQLDIS